MAQGHNAISVGVVGVGSMGQHHARIMASLSGANLVGVADAGPNRARQIASRYGVQAFEDYRVLLKQVEAVSVAAPTELHHTIGMDCLRRGVHVLMEKPLAATVGEAQELAEAADRAGVTLQVGHIERFNPTYGELVKVLQGKRILALEARRLSPFTTRASDVSVVFDLMVHDLDLILDLVKAPVLAVQAVGLQAKSPCLDHVAAHLVFDNGVVTNLIASKITQQKVRQFTVTCDDALVQADLLARTVLVHRQAVSHYQTDQNRVSYRQEGIVEQVYVPLIEPLYAEITHFLDCVRYGQQPAVGSTEAIQVLELVEVIEQAALASIESSRDGAIRFHQGSTPHP